MPGGNRCWSTCAAQHNNTNRLPHADMLNTALPAETSPTQGAASAAAETATGVGGGWASAPIPPPTPLIMRPLTQQEGVLHCPPCTAGGQQQPAPRRHAYKRHTLAAPVTPPGAAGAAGGGLWPFQGNKHRATLARNARRGCSQSLIACMQQHRHHSRPLLGMLPAPQAQPRLAHASTPAGRPATSSCRRMALSAHDGTYKQAETAPQCPAAALWSSRTLPAHTTRCAVAARPHRCCCTTAAGTVALWHYQLLPPHPQHTTAGRQAAAPTPFIPPATQPLPCTTPAHDRSGEQRCQARSNTETNTKTNQHTHQHDNRRWVVSKLS